MNRQGKFVVVLHNIRSAYNVGSIFRTAEGLGISKLYLCGYTPVPEAESAHDEKGRKNIAKHYSEASAKQIAKTALGAEGLVSWEYYTQAKRLLEKLRKEKVTIIALEQTRKSKDLMNYKPRFPMALVLGNEVRGISRAILKYCNEAIEIPMKGKKKSFNVSVAFGIAGYELVSKM